MSFNTILILVAAGTTGTVSKLYYIKIRRNIALATINEIKIFNIQK